eukprot:scaffold59398_cov69-Phaeocystis_antarctica.AAC.3
MDPRPSCPRQQRPSRLHRAVRPRFWVRCAVGQYPLQVCLDIAPPATLPWTAAAAWEAEAREGRHNRHFRGDAVLSAADDRGHVGAVRIAPRSISGEDAVDTLAQATLVVLKCRVPGDHAASEVDVRALHARIHNVHAHAHTRQVAVVVVVVGRAAVGVNAVDAPRRAHLHAQPAGHGLHARGGVIAQGQRRHVRALEAVALN